MHFMEEAILEAKKGIELGDGGPFGAVTIKGNKVISRGHNTVLKDLDPTCHAEMNAIRNASSALGTYDLSDLELYTTAEPCPMCLSAIYWARISKIHIGVTKDVAAKYGFDDDKFYQEIMLPSDKREVCEHKGVMSKECESVFERWQSLGGSLY